MASVTSKMTSKPQQTRRPPIGFLHFWNQFVPLIKMHYRVRYSLDFDLKIRSVQVCVVSAQLPEQKIVKGVYRTYSPIQKNHCICIVGSFKGHSLNRIWTHIQAHSHRSRWNKSWNMSQGIIHWLFVEFPILWINNYGCIHKITSPVWTTLEWWFSKKNRFFLKARSD